MRTPLKREKMLASWERTANRVRCLEPVVWIAAATAGGVKLTDFVAKKEERRLSVLAL